MDDLVIYEKPTCSTCRAAIALVDASGKPYRKVRYHEDRLSAKKLAELVRKLGLPASAIVRTKEARYKELGLDRASMQDADVIAVLAANPELIERPILECGERAVLGRPIANVSAFLRELTAAR